MSLWDGLAYYLVAGCVSALISWAVATVKGRPADRWALLAFLFPPALLLVLVLRTIPRERLVSTARPKISAGRLSDSQAVRHSGLSLLEGLSEHPPRPTPGSGKQDAGKLKDRP